MKTKIVTASIIVLVFVIWMSIPSPYGGGVLIKEYSKNSSDIKNADPIYTMGVPLSSLTPNPVNKPIISAERKQSINDSQKQDILRDKVFESSQSDPEIVNYIDSNDMITLDSSILLNASITNRDYFIKKLSDDAEIFSWNKIVYALGYIGDDKSVEALIEFIQREPNEKNNDIKRLAMLEACEALGIAAQTTDKAFEYLKKGLNPSFWEPYATGYRLRNKEWTNLFMSKSLVEHSIQGLGASGREEARSMIRGWIDNPNDFSIEYCDNLAQGLFYLDWISQYGVDDFRKGLCSPTHGERWDEWKKKNKSLTDWVFSNMP